MGRVLVILGIPWLLPPSLLRADEPITISAREGETMGWVGAVAFSPKGDYLAIGDASGTIQLWSVKDRDFHPRLGSQRSAVSALAFIADGVRIVSGGHDHTALLFEQSEPGGPSGSTPVGRGHAGAIHSLVVTPDGARLLTGSIDGTIRVWDFKSQRTARVLKGHTSWVNGLALSKDGSLLASAGSDNTVRLWDTKTWKNFSTLAVKEGEVRSVALSSDGKHVAAGIRYGHVRVWDLRTKKEVFSTKAHEGEAWAVAFTPDGKTLCSGGGDWNKPGEVRLWSTAGWKERAVLKHSGEVLCVAVSHDGKRLAAGGWDRTVKVWDLAGLGR